jgi:putative ABC transport system permease protein
VLAVIPLAFCYGGGELTAGDLVNYGQVVGIDPALLSYLGVEVEQGELSLEAGKVIIGGLIDDYFVDPNSTEWEPVAIDLATTPIEMGIYSYTGDRREIELDISGVLREGAGMYDGTIFMPLEDVIELNEWVMGARIDMRDFTYDQAVLRAESREATNAITEAIIEMGFQTDGMGDFLDQLNNFFTTMRLMLGGVGGIALLVAAFGVANTMTMAILERTKEIGLMKAIGARDRDVLTVFLIEAGLIGMCGGAAGVAVSLILQNTINQAMQNAPTDSSGIYFLPFDPSQIGDQLLIIPTELSLFAIGLATLVGLGAGLLPALRAARLPPVIALKQE